MAKTRELTDKELKVIQEFDKARPGLGAVAENNIRNNDKTGWADIIADTPEEKLFTGKSSSTNTFIYKRIG